MVKNKFEVEEHESGVFVVKHEGKEIACPKNQIPNAIDVFKNGITQLGGLRPSKRGGLYAK